MSGAISYLEETTTAPQGEKYSIKNDLFAKAFLKIDF